MQEQKHPTPCRVTEFGLWQAVRQGAGKALSVDKLSLSNMSLLSLRVIQSDLHSAKSTLAVITGVSSSSLVDLLSKVL